MPLFKHFWTLLIAFFLLLTACKNEESCAECEEESQAVNQVIDSVKEEVAEVEMAVKEMPKEIKMDETIQKDFVENKKKIEKKFGTQWDFCTCVKLNDSLDRVIKEGGEMDDNFMKRFDLIDTKCKAFLVMSPNQTPEERAMHEKKIRDCLK